MQEVSINLNLLEKLARERIGDRLLKELEQITYLDTLKLVYTSVDGDLLSQSEPIKNFCLKKGFVPLNPESALGTYLVVNHYQGNKKSIIEDCFSLLSKCDYFYVFADISREENPTIKSLPEGVIAEVLYRKQYSTKDVPIISTKNFEEVGKLSCSEVAKTMPKETHESSIKDLLAMPQNNLRKTAYLLAGERHAKHSDWMRKMAYTQKMVPISPYTIINNGTLRLALGENLKEHALSRASLSCKADEIWIFSPYRDNEFSTRHMEDDALLELFLSLRLKPDRKVVHISLAEAGVPKYQNREKWSLTDIERSNSKE